MPLGDPAIRYQDALAAVGRYVTEKKLTNVCVLEFENGVIVTGSLLYETGDLIRRSLVTQVLSSQDLLQLMRGAPK